MIQTYLSGVQLPINPFDDITLKTQGNNQRIEIAALGDITKIGNRKLISFEISGLFSDNVYPFGAVASPRSAAWYAEQVSGWIEDREPIRFICTGDGIDINLRCSIESFTEKHAAGEPNEIYYTLSLMEYREPVIKRVKSVKKVSKTVVKSTTVRAEKKASSAASHTVKYGDTLWGMAKTYYGNGALYPKIYEANRAITSNPNNIWVGQVYTIPPLEG